MKFYSLLLVVMTLSSVQASDYSTFAPDFKDIVYNFPNYVTNYVRANGGDTGWTTFLTDNW